MQPMTTGFPGERVGLDIMRPLLISVRGFEHVLAMVNYLTKGVEDELLLRQDTASVANATSRTWISHCGVPLSFHSNCGTKFGSQPPQEVCGILDVRKTPTTHTITKAMTSWNGSAEAYATICWRSHRMATDTTGLPVHTIRELSSGGCCQCTVFIVKIFEIRFFCYSSGR
nr:unnamed protein product [Spirometra erinaceieuropaei]